MLVDFSVIGRYELVAWGAGNASLGKESRDGISRRKVFGEVLARVPVTTRIMVGSVTIAAWVVLLRLVSRMRLFRMHRPAVAVQSILRSRRLRRFLDDYLVQVDLLLVDVEDCRRRRRCRRCRRCRRRLMRTGLHVAFPIFRPITRLSAMGRCGVVALARLRPAAADLTALTPAPPVAVYGTGRSLARLGLCQLRRTGFSRRVWLSRYLVYFFLLSSLSALCVALAPIAPCSRTVPGRRGNGRRRRARLCIA